MHAFRRGFVLAVLMLAATGLAACNDSNDDATTGTKAEESTNEDVSPDEADVSDGVVEVELVDYEFDGLPESVPAGTELVVVNTSDVEVHELVAYRIPDDEARTLDELLELHEGELQAVLGVPPALVVFAGPGAEPVVALGDGTLSEPGRYLVACMVPTGADPGEWLAAAAAAPGPPDVAGGPPHVAHGMITELAVE